MSSRAKVSRIKNLLKRAKRHREDPAAAFDDLESGRRGKRARNGSRINRDAVVIQGGEAADIGECLQPEPVKSARALRGVAPYQIIDSDRTAEELADECFDALIYPTTREDFFKTYYQKKPMHIRNKRRSPLTEKGFDENSPAAALAHLTSLFSTDLLRKYVAEPTIGLKYGNNVDLACVIGGKRETASEGRVGEIIDPKEFWECYNDGWTARILHPQEYHTALYRVVVALQSVFKCVAGVNVYLTPPNSQGFAPHWDDVDVFIVQLEGKKQWLLHPALKEDDILPRYSSRNFSKDEVAQPNYEILLDEGDVLYLPRGCTHQAMTVRNYHSMHITLSVMQRMSWADLLDEMLPIALNRTARQSLPLRQGLPLDFSSYLGTQYISTDTSSKQEEAKKTIATLLESIIKDPPMHTAADLIMSNVHHGLLPPMVALREGEAPLSNLDSCSLESEVRLISRTCLWALEQAGTCVVCHSAQNTRVYHEVDPQAIELPLEAMAAIQQLLAAYPRHIKIQDVKMEDVNDRVELIRTLADENLIVMMRKGET